MNHTACRQPKWKDGKPGRTMILFPEETILFEKKNVIINTIKVFCSG